MTTEKLKQILDKIDIDYIEALPELYIHNEAVIRAMTEAVNMAIDECAESAKTIKTGNSGSWYDASVNKESITKNKIK